MSIIFHLTQVLPVRSSAGRHRNWASWKPRFTIPTPRAGQVSLRLNPISHREENRISDGWTAPLHPRGKFSHRDARIHLGPVTWLAMPPLTGPSQWDRVGVAYLVTRFGIGGFLVRKWWNESCHPRHCGGKPSIVRHLGKTPFSLVWLCQGEITQGGLVGGWMEVFYPMHLDLSSNSPFLFFFFLFFFLKGIYHVINYGIIFN